MNHIIEWVKQIFILSVLSGLVIHLMPSGKYEQYVRFVCGIIIMAACLSPIIRLVNGQENIWDVYQNIMKWQDVHELEQEIQFYQGEDDAVVEQYRAAVCEVVERQIIADGLYPVHSEIVLDTDSQSEHFGALQQINLTVALDKGEKEDIRISIEQIDRISPGADGNRKDEELLDPRVVKLKAELADNYGLNPSNVNIVVNGEA